MRRLVHFVPLLVLACGPSTPAQNADTLDDGGLPDGAGGGRGGDASTALDGSTTPDASRDGGARAPKCRSIKSDHIGVYRPSSATFYAMNQRPGWIEPAPPITSWGYGDPGWSPVIGDWDGDGSQTHGAFNGAGDWFLSNKLGATTADVTFKFGLSGDMPLAGDWTGQGITTVGVFRRSTGEFLLRTSNDAGNGKPDVAFSLPFVQPGDVPLAGDWDGDGITSVGVFRPSSATFFLRNANSAGPPDISTPYGATGDIPVVGDWDGDGKWTIGVQRGISFLLTNTLLPSSAQITIDLGNPGDQLIVGNWNGSPQYYGSTPAGFDNFFPLAADYQPSSTFGAWSSRKANSLVRYPEPGAPYAENVDAWTNAATSAGFTMIRGPRTPPSLDANVPKLVAWDLIDEPDGPAATSASQVASLYSSAKAVSPSRPAFANFAGPVVLDTNANGCNGPGDGSNEGCYPGYIATEDWVAQDIYPVLDGADIREIGWTLDKLRRWSSGRPMFSYVQTSDINVNAAKLTPESFRGQVWESIIHGVRGIFYFAAYDCIGGPCQVADGTSAAVAAEMTKENARITALAKVLQGTINPDGIGISAPAPLEATWRHAGPDDYFIVLNPSATAVTRTLSICGEVPASPPAVVGEGRTVGSAGSVTFTDTFGPYEAHVYMVHAQ